CCAMSRATTSVSVDFTQNSTRSAARTAARSVLAAVRIVSVRPPITSCRPALSIACTWAGRAMSVTGRPARASMPPKKLPTAAACRAGGAAAVVVRAEVAKDADCRRLAAEVESRWGRADVMVNNAGTTKFVALQALEGLSADDFHRIYDVNVIGAWQMTRALAPLLRRSSGAGVVNVSSVASMMGLGSSIAYMASKGALNAMTVGLARALGPQV